MENIQINDISRIDFKDKSKITSREFNRKFGKKNDYIEFHIYDMGGNLLYSINDYQDWQYPDVLEDDNSTLTNTLFVDPTKKLLDLGFNSGQFSLVYNLQRKKVFDTFTKVFYIKEISPSRTELKIYSDVYDANEVEEAFKSYMNELSEEQFVKDLTLNFGNNINVLGINVAYDLKEKCALIKLYEPLPSDIEDKATFRIVEDIIDPIEFIVDLGTPDLIDDNIAIKGPNFRIDTRLNDSVPSSFKTYDSFLDGANSASLYNVLSKLSESVELSIDFTNTSTGSLETGYHFENFTHFGSAEERLRNFKYKLSLIELYEAQISEIGTITGTIATTATVISNRNAIEAKKGKILSNLDNYEKFLYYEHHPYAWPKIPNFGIGSMVLGLDLPNNAEEFAIGTSDCDVFTKPYNLYSTISDEAKTWFGDLEESNIDYGGQILSASRFDRDNSYNLTKTLPEHISEREENETYVTLANMIGHYFDQIWLYIDHISKIRNAHNSFTEGISKDLVFTALQSLGIEAFDQFENEELFEYIIGTNKTTEGAFGTYQASDGQTMLTADLVKCDNGGSSIPKGDITKEVWKRLYHNVPYLLKTKGTERGIRALMNCYGIPETILNIKEYGGPTTDETTYKTFNYEKFAYTLQGDSGTTGFFIEAPWYTDQPEFTGVHISTPGKAKGQIVCSMGTIGENFSPPFPKTIELEATDGSIHIFSSGIEFEIHSISGLETAQSITSTIDAHPLFSASLEVPKDLFDYNHYEYNLDLVIKIEQHLMGVEGNTPIEGSLFDDTTTPACGNPQQFPQVEFLTKTDFGTGGPEDAGGGTNNSTSVTTVVPGTNSCDSKTLIVNGKKWDGSGTKINNGLFQDKDELMAWVTDCTNGYCSYDISTFSFESSTPGAVPLYLGEKQCVGINNEGLFVIECFEVDPTCVKHSDDKNPAVCNANFTLYVSDEGATINATAEQLTDFLFMGDSGDPVINNDLTLAIPNAAGTFIWDENLNSYTGNVGDLDSSEDGGGDIYWTSPGVNNSSYLTGLEIINYLSSNCEHTGGITGNCYKIYNNLITDLNNEGYVNPAIPGVNTDTIFSELLTPDITTVFPASSSCGCDDFTVLDGPGFKANALVQFPDSGGVGTQATATIFFGSGGECDPTASIILTDSSGTLHTFDLLGAGSYVNSQQNLATAINNNSNFSAVWSEESNGELVQKITITTTATGAATNTVITGTWPGSCMYVEEDPITKYPQFSGGTGAQGDNGCATNLNGETIVLQDVNGSSHTFTITGNDIPQQLINLSNDINNNNNFYSAYTSAPYFLEIIQDQIGASGNTQIQGTAITQTSDSGVTCLSNTSFTGGINAGSSGGQSTTTTYQAPPTVNSPTVLQAGAQHNDYGSNGVKFYASSTSGNHHLNNSNTYFSNPTNNINDGRLNQIGVWDATVPFVLGQNFDQMTPMDQWVGFSECITAASDGEYLIGFAGDNRIRLIVDGNIIIEKDNPNSENFKNWWVYKIELSAGDHVINIEGKNDSNLASFGCDIVGPFPPNTFIDETVFNTIDNNGITLNGITYTDLEDLYKNNIIFSTENFGATSTNTCGSKTDTGVIGVGPAAAVAQLTYLANSSNNSQQTNFDAFTYSDTLTSGTADVCIDGSRNAEILVVTHIIIDTSGGGPFASLNNNLYNNWDDLLVDMTTITTIDYTNYSFNEIEGELLEGQNIYIFTDYCICTSTSGGGGDFNTATNTCDEVDGYFYNECTGFCEKTETVVTTTPTYCGLVQKPIGDGTFINSEDFLDHFTTYSNGFYGLNVDEYFYETFEPLPQGANVESPCLGPNGGFVRRVVGFKKDPIAVPLDNTLYLNYDVFLQQLNIDGHGVEEGIDSIMFSLLAAALILTEEEGPCDSKTLIINPNSSTGAFEGSLMEQITPIQEFMDYYSDISTSDPTLGNLQDIDVTTLKFNISEDSLNQIYQEECPIEADIYVFYDHTSMGPGAIETAFQSVNDWVLGLEQNSGFNKKVYHIHARRERWLKWGVGMLEGFADTVKFPISQYKVEEYLGAAIADNAINVYSNTDQLSDDLTTLGPPTGDVLAICYLDESDNVYVAESGDNTNTSDPYYPQFGPLEPRGPEVGHNHGDDATNFKLDYDEYVALYNSYTEGKVACFFYPTPNLDWTNPTDLTGWYTQTILSGLAAITSGDNNDGLLANPPSTPNMIATPSGTAVTGHAYYTALNTSNPYFAQGYGALDQYGWGINVTFPAMSAVQLALDLNEFIATSTLCTDFESDIGVSVITCKEDDGTDAGKFNYTFSVENFFIDPDIDVNQTPFQKYTDFITHATTGLGANNVVGVSLNDDWSDSEIGGNIEADECLCAEPCPDTLIINNNTEITITGSVLTNVFTLSEPINQPNNITGFNATIIEVNSGIDDKAIIIDITTGILNPELDIVGTNSGAVLSSLTPNQFKVSSAGIQDGSFEIGEMITQTNNVSLSAKVVEVSPNQLTTIPPIIVLEVLTGTVDSYGLITGNTSGATITEAFTITSFGEHLIPLPQGAFANFDEFMDFVSLDPTLSSTDIGTLKFELATEYTTSTTISAQTLEPGGIWYVEPSSYMHTSITTNPALIGGYEHGSPNSFFYNGEGSAVSWNIFANDRIGAFQIGETLIQAGNTGLQAVVGHLISKPFYHNQPNIYPRTLLQFQYKMVVFLSETSTAIITTGNTPLIGVTSGAEFGNPSKPGIIYYDVLNTENCILSEKAGSYSGHGPSYPSVTNAGDYYNQGNEGKSDPLHRIDLPTTTDIANTPGNELAVVDIVTKTSTTVRGKYATGGVYYNARDISHMAHREQIKIAWEWYAQNAEGQNVLHDPTGNNDSKYFSGMGFNSNWQTTNNHSGGRTVSTENTNWNNGTYGVGDPDYWMDYDGDGDGDLQGRRHIGSEIVECPSGMKGPKVNETNYGGGYATPQYIRLTGYDMSYYGYNKFYSDGGGSWKPNPQNPNNHVGYEHKIEVKHANAANNSSNRQNYVSHQNIKTHTNYPYYDLLQGTKCEFITQNPNVDNCTLPEATAGDSMGGTSFGTWYTYKSLIDYINSVRGDAALMALTVGSGSVLTPFPYATPFNVIEAELYYVQYGNSAAGDHTRPGFLNNNDDGPATTLNTGPGTCPHDDQNGAYPNIEYEFQVDFGSTIPQCIQLQPNEDVTETTSVTYDVNNLLCLGPNSSLRNKYGLFTIQGFYQNSIIDPTSTVYEYNTDTSYYTTWTDFLNTKIPQVGNTGEHFDENWPGSWQATPGTDLTTNTSYHQTTASIELANTEYTVLGEDYITTVNQFNNYPFNQNQDIYSNPYFSGIESNDAFEMLSWMLGTTPVTLNGNVCVTPPASGHTLNSMGNYFYVDMSYDNTADSGDCTCGTSEADANVIINNLPPISSNNPGNNGCNGEGKFVRPFAIKVNTDYQFETALDSNGHELSWVKYVTNLTNDGSFQDIQSFILDLKLSHSDPSKANLGTWMINGIEVDDTFATGPSFMTIINEICPDPLKRGGGTASGKLLYFTQTTATCDDVPGPLITGEDENFPNIMAPLIGQIDGTACKCAPTATGGEPLPGEIEFEGCTCCPESSSIEYGCNLAGEIDISTCDCVLPTYTTIVTEIPPDEIIDCNVTASSKTIEFRINPRRFDDAKGLSPIQLCCGPTGSPQPHIHLFSLYNPNFQGSDPHLLLEPYVGPDISSSGDYKQWGSLTLTVGGAVRATSELFPAFNGDFWNIFIGTEGRSGISDFVDFGAYQSNFLGNVTYTTASALFTEYERAVTFGDAVNNCENTTPATLAYFGGHPGYAEAYSGSFQEIKYHTTEYLNHDTLVKHALDPFQYSGNTVSSSWGNVFLRLP